MMLMKAAVGTCWLQCH